MEDSRQLDRIGLVVAAAGVALFVAMAALPWFAITAEAVDEELAPVAFEETRNAFQSFAIIDLLLIATVVVAILMPGLRSLAPSVAARLPLAGIAIALALLSLILVVANVVVPPDFVVAEDPRLGTLRVSDLDATEVEPRAGAWVGIGLLAALAASAAVAGSRPTARARRTLP